MLLIKFKGKKLFLITKMMKEIASLPKELFNRRNELSLNN
jgi:hypothetical protein